MACSAASTIDRFCGEWALLENSAPYPLTFRGRSYPDAAAALVDLAPHAEPDAESVASQTLLVEVLAAKFAVGSPAAEVLAATGDAFLSGGSAGPSNVLGRLLMARRSLNAAVRSTSSGAVPPVFDSRSDVWDLWLSGAWAVIPTNEQCRADGSAVMGAGLARGAADRFTGLDVRYGDALRAGRSRMAYRDLRLLLVPTKKHWRHRSTLEMVSTAADGVASWCAAHPGEVVAVPALGAGLGALDAAAVRRVLVDGLAGCAAVLLDPR